MNTKWKIILPLLASLCVITGLFIGRWMYKTPSAFMSSGSSPVDEVLNLADHEYTDSVNMDTLSEAAIEAMLSLLDPHSVYIPKKDLQMVNDDMSGSFSGIGVQFNIQRDTVTIISVIHGGPSEKLGILPGDRIISVDGKPFVGKSLSNEMVVSTLRGKKGTKVKIGIRRSSSPKPLLFTIVRGDVPVKTVETFYLAAPRTGYVKVSSFGEQTFSEFQTALAQLKRQEADRFIIDLRGNPGGYLDAVIRMVNEFLEKGDMIVYTEGRSYPRQDSRADGSGSFKGTPIVVLIDEWSASASEIFAGAIQDNDRGLIIGRRSFGKGLVQQQYPLSNGAAVRLTIARYYTPSGRCIQKPYAKGDRSSYDLEVVERFTHGELTNADSVKNNKTQSYKTKLGRTVYGGGGISPDRFVGRDTTGFTPYFNRITEEGLLNDFAFRYADTHRSEFRSYRTWQEVLTHLQRASLLKDFTLYAEKKGVKGEMNQILKSSKLIEKQLFSLIARDAMPDETFFYRIYNNDDAAIRLAIQELSKK